MSRLRSILAFALATVVATTALPATSAHASASCHGNTCRGLLASAVGCTDDAFVIAGFTLNDPTLAGPSHADLFYSRACHSAWGEYNTPSGPNDLHLIALYSLPYNAAGGAVEEFRVLGNSSNTTTTMANWDGSVRFCVFYQRDRVDPGDDRNACSRWR